MRIVARIRIMSASYRVEGAVRPYLAPPSKASLMASSMSELLYRVPVDSGRQAASELSPYLLWDRKLTSTVATIGLPAKDKGRDRRGKESSREREDGGELHGCKMACETTGRRRSTSVLTASSTSSTAGFIQLQPAPVAPEVEYGLRIDACAWPHCPHVRAQR